MPSHSATPLSPAPPAGASSPLAASAAARRRVATALKAERVVQFDDFVAAFRAGPMERVGWIKAGMPADYAVFVAREMNIPKERLFGTLGLARATVDRKVRERRLLSRDESAMLLGAARLVGQVQAMVEESGEPEGFHAAEWVAGWLERPLPALAGRRPAELMDTAEGQAIVANLLDRTRTGAYA